MTAADRPAAAVSAGREHRDAGLGCRLAEHELTYAEVSTYARPPPAAPEVTVPA